jgi:hypothetical protein
MATATDAPVTSAPAMALSTPRRDLAVALASLWLVSGLYLDGWAHTHVPELETFFTPWHGVLYSGYVALALALVPARLWRGRPAGPVRHWVPAGYGLGLLGAVLFAAAGAIDMTWHTLLGIEVGLEALLSPPHLLLLTAGTLMITSPVRAAAARRRAASPVPTSPVPAPPGTAPPGTAPSVRGDLPVVVCMVSAVGVAAFFLEYLSPFIDVPTAFEARFHRFGGSDQAFGLGQHLTFTTLVVVAALFVWTRLGRLPAGLITAVVAAAAVPTGVLNDFEHLAAQLWPLVGAVVADAAVQWVAARRPRLVPVAAGVLVPPLVWATHLIGVQTSVGVAWTVELWSGTVVLTTLAGAVLGTLLVTAGPDDPAAGR